MKQLENSEHKDSTEEVVEEVKQDEKPKSKKSGAVLFFLIFLVLAGAMAAAGYFGWMEFNKIQQANLQQIDSLNTKITELEADTSSQLKQALNPLQQSVGKADNRLAGLEQQQQSLLTSTEKLYELYGRDKNGWKLAEVEYLMSIAQHKLVLENDFEGAAKTLNAASERIGELADPGLLTVRVKINDEIAVLKTRVRPDLVGMTLLSARLTRQIIHLKPGYQSVENKTEPAESEPEQKEPSEQTMDQQVMDFISSLVTVNTSKPKVEQVEQAAIIDVTQKLEDNLKLTRWSILERDAYQFDRLMQQNVEWFKQYYDLENAANADFYESLLRLQKSTLKPDIPDISGSLLLLREIQKKRENAPETVNSEEADNG